MWISSSIYFFWYHPHSGFFWYHTSSLEQPSTSSKRFGFLRFNSHSQRWGNWKSGDVHPPIWFLLWSLMLLCLWSLKNFELLGAQNVKCEASFRPCICFTTLEGTSIRLHFPLAGTWMLPTLCTSFSETSIIFTFWGIFSLTPPFQNWKSPKNNKSKVDGGDPLPSFGSKPHDLDIVLRQKSWPWRCWSCKKRICKRITFGSFSLGRCWSYRIYWCLMICILCWYIDLRTVRVKGVDHIIYKKKNVANIPTTTHVFCLWHFLNSIFVHTILTFRNLRKGSQKFPQNP